MDHPGANFGRPGSTETSPRGLFGSIPSASEIFPDINDMNEEDTRLRHARSEQPDVATASREGEPPKKRLHRAPPPWTTGGVPSIAEPGAGLDLDQPLVRARGYAAYIRYSNHITNACLRGKHRCREMGQTWVKSSRHRVCIILTAAAAAAVYFHTCLFRLT